MVVLKNMKDLEKYVKQATKKAMNQGSAVKDTVIQEGKMQVQVSVYDVYTPKAYERTGELKESWETEPTSEGIAVFNTRRDGDKDIVDTVEYGRNYDYDFEYANKARPFIENTRVALARGNQLTEALKKDMKAQGYDVK